MDKVPPSVGGTYRILDITGDRFYIGSTANLRKRRYSHWFHLKRGTHPNQVLQAIWNREPTRLSFQVVEVLPQANRKERLDIEQGLLDAASVGSNRACMNILAVAGSHEGARRSAETRARLALVNKGRSPSAETRAKMRAAKLGRPLSEAHREKIAVSGRGRPGPRHSAAQLAIWRKHPPEKIRELRRLHARGQDIPSASRSLGIAISSAYRIIRGETYADVA